MEVKKKINGADTEMGYCPFALGAQAGALGAEHRRARHGADTQS